MPQVHHRLTGVVHEVTANYLTIMYNRIDELFVRSIESTSADQELITSINEIRFHNFDQVLEEAMMVAKEDSPGNMSKDDLKYHLMEILGHAYMHLHAIGYGTSLNVEEARAVLTAYWGICEKRISEDIFSSVDTVLLKQCSIQIEEDLLTYVQTWLNDNEQLELLFHEDIVVQEERRKLMVLVKKIGKALDQLDSLIPNCIAKDPSGLDVDNTTLMSTTNVVAGQSTEEAEEEVIDGSW